MTGKPTETDKDILRRIISEPTFEKVRDAAILENRKREQRIRDTLIDAAPDPVKEGE